MSKNLMFNRFSQTFHLSHNPFACIKRNEKVGFFGKAVKLAPTVYAIIVPSKVEEARQKQETSVPSSTPSGLAFVWYWSSSRRSSNGSLLCGLSGRPYGLHLSHEAFG
ncbi:hypothetical protein [Enterobacter phage 02_vB_Eclo_IJM]|nr:hypothetical protein [Enterobacter phage 02_vB_Eclo_IJM]